MRGLWIGLAITAGCGRVGFDAVAPGAADARGGADSPGDVGAPAQLAPLTFVQANATSPAGGAVVTCSFNMPIAQGSLLVAAFDYLPGDTFSPVSITDTVGSTYTIVGGTIGPDTARQWIAYALAPSAGTNTVTLTLDGAPAVAYDLRIHEYTGASTTAPFDTWAGTSGTTTGTDAARSPAVTTTATNELVFGFVTYNTFGSQGSTFTLRNSYGGDITEDITAAAPGPYVATGSTVSSPSWIAIVATFRGR
jgi:hypothetical protein